MSRQNAHKEHRDSETLFSRQYDRSLLQTFQISKNRINQEPIHFSIYLERTNMIHSAHYQLFQLVNDSGSSTALLNVG